MATLAEKVQEARKLQAAIAVLQSKVEAYQEDLYVNHRYLLKN